MIKDYDVSVSEWKQGYTEENDSFHCLFCESIYLKGDIYSFGNRLVEAKTAIHLHIEEIHQSAFHVLIHEDKKNTGLSNVQRDLLSYFYDGISDKEIATITNTATSTVRYQRFNIKEKAKQAKLFLALFELMDEKAKEEHKISIHSGATMVDERYITSEEERQKITANFFASMSPLILKTFSSKEKNKLVILKIISEQFDKEKRYKEKEINFILQSIYHDYATIRRYLIEYGFMERTPNCQEYWLK